MTEETHSCVCMSLFWSHRDTKIFGFSPNICTLHVRTAVYAVSYANVFCLFISWFCPPLPSSSNHADLDMGYIMPRYAEWIMVAPEKNTNFYILLQVNKFEFYLLLK